MALRNVSDFLPNLLGPVQLKVNGTLFPAPRLTWDFTGDVALVDHVDEDNPENSYIELVIGGGAGGEIFGFGPTIANSGTGTLNNIASLDGATKASAIRFTGVAPTVTGIANGADKRWLLLLATGGPLIIANESGSSTAANRIITGTGGDLTIADEGTALLAYDPTSSRWRVAATNGGVTKVPPIANASTGTLNDVVSTSSGIPSTGIRFSGAAPVVTGIASGTPGRRLTIFATGGPVVLKHEDAGSTAANRIVASSSADVVVDNGAVATLVYDGTSSRWRLDEEPAPSLANASTGTLNDVASIDASGNPVSLVRFSGAAPVVNGFAGGTAARRLYVITTGGALVLSNEAAGSVAANRIITGTGADVTIADEETAELVYDAASSRWRMLRVGAAGITPGNRGEVYETFDSGSGAAVRWGKRDLAALANASTGNLDNVATTDANSNPVGAIRFSGAAPVLRGLAGGTDNRQLDLITTGGPLQINNEDANSTAANRIITGTGGNVTIADESTASVVYDAASSRWRLKLGAAPEITPGANNTVATSNGTAVVWQTIVDANVNASAAIARTKLQLLTADGDVFMRTAGANASGKIADTNVATGAAIASSKIAGVNGQVAHGVSGGIGFHSGLTYDGAGFLATTALGLNGGTQHTTARIRLPYNGGSTVIILGVKNSGGTDAQLVQFGSGDQWQLGSTLLDLVIRTFGSISISGSVGYASIDSLKWGIALPLAGDSANSQPFRFKRASVNVGGGVTLSAAQYECPVLEFTGTAGNVTHPGSAGEWHTAWNNASTTCTMLPGSVTIASAQGRVYFFDGSASRPGSAAGS